MDPRNRLWTNLVFPRCEPSSLLALRAVCRAFLAQLNAAPAALWQPLTMFNERMSYAERLLGWSGVERALERERMTRDNCSIGRVAHSHKWSFHGAVAVAYAGGRVVAFFRKLIELYDCETGALVASLIVESVSITTSSVCDRWLPVVARGDSFHLIDCVAATLVDVAAPIGRVTSSGACLCIRPTPSIAATILRVTSSSSGSTVVRQVARIDLANSLDAVVLCQQGRAFVLFESQKETLTVIDLATRQKLRSLTPPSGMSLLGVDAVWATLFVLVRGNVGGRLTHVLMRPSDGWSSCTFLQLSLIHPATDFVIASHYVTSTVDIINAETGSLVFQSRFKNARADSSGSLIMQDDKQQLYASYSADRSGPECVVLDACPAVPRAFAYGVCVCVDMQGYQYRLLRFDRAVERMFFMPTRSCRRQIPVAAPV